MAKYELKDDTLEMAYTGIVNPKVEWVEGADGRRVRSDVQALDDHGVPLWLGSTTRLTENFGRQSETLADVTAPSPERPNVRRHDDAQFVGLAVEVRVNKTTGQLVETFTALGLVE